MARSTQHAKYATHRICIPHQSSQTALIALIEWRRCRPSRKGRNLGPHPRMRPNCSVKAVVASLRPVCIVIRRTRSHGLTGLPVVRRRQRVEWHRRQIHRRSLRCLRGNRVSDSRLIRQRLCLGRQPIALRGGRQRHRRWAHCTAIAGLRRRPVRSELGR